jgi:glycosyltransferase involved in cell wall biosynthesis
MRILYVSMLWFGFQGLILRGEREPTGMPGFIRPLKRLLELGHQVDMVLAAPEDSGPLNVGADWLAPVSFEFVPWSPRGLERMRSPLRLWRAARRALSRNAYDFIYGQENAGVLGCLAARQAGISCGQRIYGTQYVKEILSQSRLRLLRDHPLEYLSWTTGKNFLLCTDDGSRGDLVQRQLCPNPPYGFHFWRNGIDLDFVRAADAAPIFPDPFLFFPARVVPWKNHLAGVEILRKLHALGHDSVHLLVCGQISNQVYWQRVMDEVKQSGLGAFVHHLGALPTMSIPPYLRQAIAVLAPYELANVSNAVIETLAVGGVIVTLDVNNPSLAAVVQDGENGITAASPADAGRRLAELISEPERARALREQAATRARDAFPWWDERVEREIMLIQATVEQRRHRRAAPGAALGARERSRA